MSPKSRSSSKIPVDPPRPGIRRQSSSGTSMQGRKTSEDTVPTTRVLDRRANTLGKRSPRRISRGNVNRGRDLSADTDAEDGYAIGNEVQALKKKVGRIEKQLSEILEGNPREGRGKQRREVEWEDQGSLNSREEGYTKLQQQLESAREELSSLRTREDNQIARSKGNPSIKPSDGAEEIPRLPPGMEARRRPLGRAVTLSGRYDIPLPETVRAQDLETIKRGINSAQNLARSFMDERTTTTTFRKEINTISSSPSESPTSWTSWIGGYTLSIARAVDRLQLSTTVETSSTSRPSLLLTGGSGGRSDVGSTTGRRKPRKLELRSGNEAPLSAMVKRTRSDSQDAQTNS
ncbi:hypothetical protein E6O75_ATG11109 [Venturia nashicola]|uniref:Uncharacterized protein n=1 Tax=Venturia nashicola TaxID=86259 RepID=A0A4Z1P371_9PEZI|nr:hypothetical protein E6O75_ATG11109 [Venturia nashicola]